MQLCSVKPIFSGIISSLNVVALKKNIVWLHGDFLVHVSSQRNNQIKLNNCDKTNKWLYMDINMHGSRKCRQGVLKLFLVINVPQRAVPTSLDKRLYLRSQIASRVSIRGVLFPVYLVNNVFRKALYRPPLTSNCTRGVQLLLEGVHSSISKDIYSHL